MALRLFINSSRPLSGNNRSHSLRATRRKWNLNVHKQQLFIDGKFRSVYLTARDLRTLKKCAPGLFNPCSEECECHHEHAAEAAPAVEAQNA